MSFPHTARANTSRHARQTSEQNPILADRLMNAQSQIRSETGDCISNVHQDITARVRALRLLLRDLEA